MSDGDDWKPGDLALCVKRDRPSRFGAAPGHSEPSEGGVYSVEAVVIHRFWGDVGLVLAGHHSNHPGGPAWLATSFRKINPLTDEERDEFLADLNVSVRAVMPLSSAGDAA